jgi:hypothetical protein
VLIYVTVRQEDIDYRGRDVAYYSPVRRALHRAWNNFIAPEEKLPERAFSLNHKRLMLNPQVLDTQHPEFTSKGLGMRCSVWLMQRVRMLDEGGNVEPFDFYFSVPDCVDPKYRTMGSRHARMDGVVTILPAVWRPATAGGVL